MAGWRRVVELAMTCEEIERLTALSRSRTEPASRVSRAQMLLAYRENPSFCAVGQRVGVHHQTVQRCVERALGYGPLAAIEDRPRPGKNQSSRRRPKPPPCAPVRNRTGKRTGRLNGWTQSRVRGFRNTHGITVYRDGEWAERGEVTLPEAARMLNLSPLTVLRQICAGVIPAKQHCAGAPWVIKRQDIEDPHVIERFRASCKSPSSSNPNQKTFVFQ